MATMQIISVSIADHLSGLLANIRDILCNSRVEPPALPSGESAVAIRNHERGGIYTAEILPSPGLLRWLADHIEADLTARG